MQDLGSKNRLCLSSEPQVVLLRRTRVTSSLHSCWGCWTLTATLTQQPIRHPCILAQAAQASDKGPCSHEVQPSSSTEFPAPAKYSVAASYMQSLAPCVQEEDELPSLVTEVISLKLSLSEAQQLAASAEHKPALTFSCQWHSPLAPRPTLHSALAPHGSTKKTWG